MNLNISNDQYHNTTVYTLFFPTPTILNGKDYLFDPVAIDYKQHAG